MITWPAKTPPANETDKSFNIQSYFFRSEKQYRKNLPTYYQIKK